MRVDVRGVGSLPYLGDGLLRGSTGPSSPSSVASFSTFRTAVHLGFARNVASKLVLQTVSGTTTLAMKSGLHPAILRNSVTSPGGTTASALYVLEQGRFRTVLADSFWSAYRRSLELGHMDSNVGPGRSRHDAHETDSHKK